MKKSVEYVQEKEIQPPTEMICPITLCLMKDPVVASDGFSYERAAIAEVIMRAGIGNPARSPMTQARLSNSLMNNQILKNQIVAWTDANCKTDKVSQTQKKTPIFMFGSASATTPPSATPTATSTTATPSARAAAAAAVDSDDDLPPLVYDAPANTIPSATTAAAIATAAATTAAAVSITARTASTASATTTRPPARIRRRNRDPTMEEMLARREVSHAIGSHGFEISRTPRATALRSSPSSASRTTTGASVGTVPSGVRHVPTLVSTAAPARVQTTTTATTASTSTTGLSDHTFVHAASPPTGLLTVVMDGLKNRRWPRVWSMDLRVWSPIFLSFCTLAVHVYCQVYMFVLQAGAVIKWGAMAVYESPVLTRLVLAQNILYVLVSLRSELYSTFVVACVCVGAFSIVEVVLYQWYLTAHFGAPLERVCRVRRLTLARIGLWAFLRDHVIHPAFEGVGLDCTLFPEGREVTAKGVCGVVGGAYVVGGVVVGMLYPWQSLFVLNIVLGPHVANHVVFRLLNVDYCNMTSYCCGSHLLSVSSLRYFWCVMSFWGELARDAEGNSSIGNAAMHGIAALWFCAETTLILRRNDFIYPAGALPAALQSRSGPTARMGTRYCADHGLQGCGGVALSALWMLSSLRHFVPNLLWLFECLIVFSMSIHGSNDRVQMGNGYDLRQGRLEASSLRMQMNMRPFMDVCFPLVFIFLATIPAPVEFIPVSWRMNCLHQISLLPSHHTNIPPFVQYYFMLFTFTQMSGREVVRDVLFLLTRWVLGKGLLRYVYHAPYVGLPVAPVCMRHPPSTGDLVFITGGEPFGTIDEEGHLDQQGCFVGDLYSASVMHHAIDEMFCVYVVEDVGLAHRFAHATEIAGVKLPPYLDR